MTLPESRRGECRYIGVPVKLDSIETRIVEHLLLRRGRPTRTGDLIAAAWPDPDAEPESSELSLFVLLSRLRRKLPGCIQGRWHYGYVIE